MKLPRLPISFVRMFSYPWVANPYLPQSCAQYGVLNSQMNGPASSVPISRVPFSTVPAHCLHPHTPVVVSCPTTVHGLPYHGLQINSGISHLSNFAAGAAAQVPAAAVQVSASVPAPTTSHGLVYTLSRPDHLIYSYPVPGVQVIAGAQNAAFPSFVCGPTYSSVVGEGTRTSKHAYRYYPFEVKQEYCDLRMKQQDGRLTRQQYEVKLKEFLARNSHLTQSPNYKHTV